MTRPSLITGVAALALLVGSSAVAGPVGSQTTDLQSFSGTWELAGGHTNLTNALNRVSDQLNLFIREIARSELHRRIRPERRLSLGVEDGSGLRLGWDSWGPVRLVVGQGARQVTGPDGNRIRASLRFQNGRLTQRHVADQGSRVTTYQLSPDARTLTMGVRITASQLPVDIVYRLRYRRTS